MAPAWTPITQGSDNSVVLGVDFYTTGRSAATFRDLAGLLPDQVNLWHAMMPPNNRGQRMTVENYLSWWQDALARDRTVVRMVLGYCAGCAFATALADGITEYQRWRPTVVHLDPGAPTIGTITSEFLSAVNTMPALNADERADLYRQAESLNATEQDFDAASSEFVTLFTRANTLAAQHLGIPADLADQLTRVFESYVAYQTAARDMYSTRQDESVTAILSRHSQDSGCREETRFDVDGENLLRSPDVATAIGNLVRDSG